MDIYLGLGSNLGDRRALLAAAIDSLAAAGLEIARVSPVVESPAMLPDDAPTDWNRPFLNLVVECRGPYGPIELLDRVKQVERALGRGEQGRWAPRPIDIDILLWGDERIATDRLTVPHPGLAERAFVLTPLAHLEPRLAIPGARGATVLELARRHRQRMPLWMGIVNLTPDSFSDGGELPDSQSVDARVDAMVSAGAHLIDLGAESTRPGATPIPPEQEWARLEPVLARLLEKHASARLKPLISVDTYHPYTAARALELGADLINDVSGLTQPEMIEIAGATGKDWIAMHHVSVPPDPSKILPVDRDPCDAVERWVEDRLEQWQRAGLDPERIIFDPGVGFGKNALQSLRVLRDIARFQRYGLRVLVGHSRKSFMHGFAASDKFERDLFTVGASLNLAAQGVEILRVHDIAAHVSVHRGWSHLL